MVCPIFEDLLGEDDRFAMMIDGSNLFQTARALDVDIDFRLLREISAQTARLLRASYYTVLPDEQEYSPLRPLADWLAYNGYSVVTKPLKKITNENGYRWRRGNISVELSIDAMDLAPKLDHLLLFSGDGVYRRLIESLQSKGIHVTVVSAVNAQSCMVADELRRQADTFLDLQDLAPWIARERQAASAAA